MDVHQRCSKLGKVWRRLPAASWDKAGPSAKSNNTFRELKAWFKWARTVRPNLSSSPFFALEFENCSGFLTFFLFCDNLKRGQLGGEAVTPTAVSPLLYSHALLHHFDLVSPLRLFLHPAFLLPQFSPPFVCLEALHLKFISQVRPFDVWTLVSSLSFWSSVIFYFISYITSNILAPFTVSVTLGVTHDANTPASLLWHCLPTRSRLSQILLEVHKTSSCCYYNNKVDLWCILWGFLKQFLILPKCTN